MLNKETQYAILLTITTVGFALVALDYLANPEYGCNDFDTTTCSYTSPTETDTLNWSMKSFIDYGKNTSPPTTEIDSLRAELAAHIESDKRQTEINCLIDLQQSRYLFPEDVVQWQMERCMSTYRGNQP